MARSNIAEPLASDLESAMISLMPWYAWIYLAGLSVLIIYSAFDDLRDGAQFAVVVIDLLEGCAYWMFVMLWNEEILPPWAMAVPILLIATPFWTIRRARQAFRQMFAEQSELTQVERRLGAWIAMLVGTTVVAPAFVAGAVVAYRLFVGR